MPKHGSIRKVYACLAVTCHLHFWQNDRDFLRATAVTRGWDGYRNKSQHRKSTLEKKILPPFQQGFEPATFQSRVRRSNHWAIPVTLECYCAIQRDQVALLNVSISGFEIAGGWVKKQDIPKHNNGCRHYAVWPAHGFSVTHVPPWLMTVDRSCWSVALRPQYRNRRFIRDGSPGRPPPLSHSSWALWTKGIFF